MKILVVSDEESKKIWDYYEPGMLDDYELILSCGDLSPRYLEFLATMSHATILYVRGNHDDIYLEDPPQGCICIEDQIYEYKGLKIAGLGGSHKYKSGKNMYTQKEMNRRVSKLCFKARCKRIKHIDILLTHAPAYDFHDASDLAHIGFEAFYRILDKFTPRFFLHGHVHKSYGNAYQREDNYKHTRVINAFGVVEIDFYQRNPS